MFPLLPSSNAQRRVPYQHFVVLFINDEADYYSASVGEANRWNALHGSAHERNFCIAVLLSKVWRYRDHCQHVLDKKNSLFFDLICLPKCFGSFCFFNVTGEGVLRYYKMVMKSSPGWYFWTLCVQWTFESVATDSMAPFTWMSQTDRFAHNLSFLGLQESLLDVFPTHQFHSNATKSQIIHDHAFYIYNSYYWDFYSGYLISFVSLLFAILCSQKGTNQCFKSGSRTQPWRGPRYFPFSQKQLRFPTLTT